MEENNNILSRYDAVAKQAGNFGIDAQRYFTVFDLKCQIALALGADVQDVKDCLSVYDVDYLIYKTYGGTLSKLDLMSDYDVLVATAAILDSGVDTSLIDSEYIAEMTLVDLMVPMSNEYFYLEAISDNTEFVVGYEVGSPLLNLEFSFNGEKWYKWDYRSNHRIELNTNQRVYLRGQNEEWTTIEGTDELNWKQNNIITLRGKEFNIGGRLSSLFTGNDEESDKSITMTKIFIGSKCRDASKLIVPKNAKLSYAFSGCESLISAPKTLSDSIIHNSQYRNMFEGCSSLKDAPQLPAKKMSKDCYMSLFQNCTSLTKSPELPAISLEESCFNRMFAGCSSLVDVPELPSTSLAVRCYYRMFYNCTSIRSFDFGDQSVYSSSKNSCGDMLSGCSNLSYIRCLYDNRDGGGPRGFANWTSGVPSQGTFVTNTDKWETGPNGIPNGWNVVIEGTTA